jgi:hypothetical protein
MPAPAKPVTLLGAVALVLAVPKRASAADPGEERAPSGPLRQGFTLELGIGAAVTAVTSEVTTSCFGTGCPPEDSTETVTDTYVGLAPLSLGIGAFVSPQVALLFRSAGSTYFKGSRQWLSTLYGGVIQYWPSDIVMLSAGPGVAVYGENPFASHYGYGSPTLTGFGFSVRGGLSFANFTHHSLRLALELLPAFYDKRSTFGTTFTFEWQYF